MGSSRRAPWHLPRGARTAFPPGGRCLPTAGRPPGSAPNQHRKTDPLPAGSGSKPRDCNDVPVRQPAPDEERVRSTSSGPYIVCGCRRPPAARVFAPPRQGPFGLAPLDYARDRQDKPGGSARNQDTTRRVGGLSRLAELCYKCTFFGWGCGCLCAPSADFLHASKPIESRPSTGPTRRCAG